MVAMRVNPKWQDEIMAKIEALKDGGGPIDETTSFNKAVNWLVLVLLNNKIPYKIYNCGGGVKRITTETDKCPCCKRKF